MLPELELDTFPIDAYERPYELPFIWYFYFERAVDVWAQSSDAFLVSHVKNRMWQSGKLNGNETIRNYLLYSIYSLLNATNHSTLSLPAWKR